MIAGNLARGYSAYGADVHMHGVAHVLQNVGLLLTVLIGTMYLWFKGSDSSVKSMKIGYALIIGGLFVSCISSYVVSLIAAN